MPLVQRSKSSAPFLSEHTSARYHQTVDLYGNTDYIVEHLCNEDEDATLDLARRR